MTTLIDSILAIKPDAVVTITGDDIIWNDGNPTNITKEQILIKQSELKTAYTNSITQKATDKASANAKLKALGLTDDEIKAIKS